MSLRESDPAEVTTFAMVGTGRMAAVMARDLAIVPFARLSAVVSRSLGRARAFAAEFDVPIAVTPARLATLEVDVVYIATPHDSHAELACAAIEAGKHVLLEKAFTMDAVEAQQVADMAEASGLFLMEAMWMRFNPAIRRIHELLLGGMIGVPRTLCASFGRAVPYDPAHRLWDPQRGGGSVLDQCVYPVALADLVFGVPRSVAATGSRLGYDGRDAGVDTEAAVLLGYAGGQQCLASSSLRAELPRRATIAGAEGRIEIDEPFWCPSGFAIHRAGVDAERIDVVIEGQGYVPMLRAVHEGVTRGWTEHPVSPVAASVRVMRVLDEVRRQITTG